MKCCLTLYVWEYDVSLPGSTCGTAQCNIVLCGIKKSGARKRGVLDHTLHCKYRNVFCAEVWLGVMLLSLIGVAECNLI